MEVIDSPITNSPQQRQTVKILLLGLSVSGHMSTTPVTRLSTRQNSLSIPII